MGDGLGDKTKGKIEELGGKGREEFGEATGNPDMEAQGEADQAHGKFDQAKGNVKDAAGNVGDTIKKTADDIRN
ncbi:MAG: CsbD family protein [Chloroflexia bacterium]